MSMKNSIFENKYSTTKYKNSIYAFVRADKYVKIKKEPFHKGSFLSFQ